MLNNQSAVAFVFIFISIWTISLFYAGGESKTVVSILDERSDLRCPIDNSAYNNSIERRNNGIRWTKLPKEAFIAELYEDGNKSYIIDGKYCIEDSRLTTLVIRNTTKHDAGEYLCRVRYHTSSPKLGRVTLYVSEPFNIEVVVAGNRDSTDILPTINRTVGSTLRANCSAMFRTPYGTLNLKWFVNDTVLSDPYTRQNFLNVTLGKGYTAFSEFTLGNISRTDTGLHTCRAVYKDNWKSKRQKSFFLKVLPAGLDDGHLDEEDEDTDKSSNTVLHLIITTVCVATILIISIIICMTLRNKSSSKMVDNIQNADGKLLEQQL